MTTSETDKIYARIAELSQEVTNLRQGYTIVNKRYGDAIRSLRDRVGHAAEAATEAVESTASVAAANLSAKKAHEQRLQSRRKVVIKIAHFAIFRGLTGN